jgi:hypothetical protein
LNCTTGSSNPASDIKWFNGSIELENGQRYIESSGENNGVVRSQILVLYPTRYMNGNEISCSVYNTENLETPVKDSAKLSIQCKYLNYMWFKIKLNEHEMRYFNWFQNGICFGT